MSRKRIFLIVLVLTIIAFFIRVLPFGYGMAYLDFADTDLFGQALNLGDTIAQKSGFHQLTTPVDYPYLFPYVFLFFFGIFGLLAKLGGIIVSSAEFIKYAILQMDKLFELSRIIVAISGTLLVPLVYFATRRLILNGQKQEKKWAITSSLLATALMAFSLLHAHFAKVIRPHVLVGLFLFTSFYFYLVLLKKKNIISYVLLGIFAGMSFGTLQNGILALWFLFLGHALAKKKLFSRNLIVAVLSFLIIAFVCYPYLFLSFNKSINLKTGEINLSLSGEHHTNFANLSNFNGSGFIKEIKGLFFYEPSIIIILLTLITALALVKIKNKTNTESLYDKQGLVGIISFIIIYFVLFGIYSGTGYRTLAPLIPFLCSIAGVATFCALNKISKKYSCYLITFIALILIFSIVQSLRLTMLVLKKNTQNLTAEWLKNNVADEEIVAIENHAGIKITPSKAVLDKRVELLGQDSLGKKDKFLIALDKKEYPKNSISAFPLFTFKEDYDKMQKFLKKDADYLVIGRYSTNADIAPPADAAYQIISSLDKNLVQQFNPFKNDYQGFSNFPNFEINNPIIDLWKYERLGPIVEIYKIIHE